MLGSWYDLESLEILHQDEAMRAIVLRMANLARADRLGFFVDAVGADAELDEETKATVIELAGERTFLLAFAEYARGCRYLH